MGICLLKGTVITNKEHPGEIPPKITVKVLNRATLLFILCSHWIVTIYFDQKQWNLCFISTVLLKTKNIVNGDGIYFKYALYVIGVIGSAVVNSSAFHAGV